MSGQHPPAALAAATPPDGRCSRFEAPAHWQSIDFISDLHLDERHPLTTQAWMNYLAGTQADAVFILGDLFEAWVGDDMRTLPFEGRCVDALRAAGQRLTLGIMVGNRDFLMGEDLRQACQAIALADPMKLSAFGQDHLVTHGDAWCLADTAYLQVRQHIRSPAWQQAFLAKPLERRLAEARAMREASEAHKADQGPMDWADLDATHTAAWLQATQTRSLIHGHTHQPGDAPFGLPDAVRHVLSDWDLDHGHPRAEVLRLTADGFTRLTPAQACR
ncbi:MAG: hypothetical protein RI907_1774 [Pseudomonadota bacterium]|jgi:UDP-2,3-diacylglucosamine hydrolase